MKAGFLIFAAVLNCCLRLPAQSADMSVWLNVGSAAEIKQRLVNLGVGEEEASSAVGPIQWKPIRNGARDDYSVLFLPCRLDSADIYLLKGDGQQWKITDHDQFDCHYDSSVSFELLDLQRPRFDDLLIHHVGEGHGGGYSQQDFQVFVVAKGKLEMVLDAEEVIVASPKPGPPHDLVQRSQFVAVPTERSHPYDIEETRSSTLNGRLTVQRRYFRWIESARRYLPSRFIPLTHK